MHVERAMLAVALAVTVFAGACSAPIAPDGCETAPGACGTTDAGPCVPGAPSDVVAVAGNGSAEISWGAPSSECTSPITSFTVTATPGGAVASTATGEARTLVVEGLTNGTAYTFVVTANDANGSGAASAPSDAVVPRTVPGAPLNLVAAGAGGSVALTWEREASNGGAAVTGYVVRRGSEGAAVVVAGRTDAQTLAFVDTALEEGLVYDYDVRAMNAAGEGASATAQAITRPGQPTGLVATATQASIALTWGEVRGAALYRVFRSQDALDVAEIATVTTPAHLDEGLAAGTRYTYVVRAVNDAGEGPSSTEASAVTAPGAPSELRAVADLSSGMPVVALSWAAAPTATSYEVLRSRTAGSGHASIGTTTTTTLTDELVAAGIEYFYVVRAVSAVGASDPSVEASVTTPALPTLVATLASATAITNDPAVALTLSSCIGRSAIFVNEGAAPAPDASGWQPCSTAPGAIITTLAGAAQGERTLKVWARDRVDNVEGPAAVKLVFDSTPPAIAIAPLDAPLRGGTVHAVGFTVTEASASSTQSFSFEASTDDGATWSSAETVSAANGPLVDAAFTRSWTTPLVDSARMRVRVSFTDLAGNTTVVTSGAFTVDSTAPTFTAGGFSINSGAASTTSNFVRMALSGTDALTRITHFCLKFVNQAPSAGDACWTPVDGATPGLVSGTGLTLTSFPYTVGFIRGSYTVHGWLRDEAGNASSLIDPAACATTSGTDCASIAFKSPEPPVIATLQSTRSDAPSSPPSAADLTISAGGDVHVKWQVSDLAALPSTAVTLSYATDGMNDVTIASGLPNAAGAGCTLSGALTGCYRWSPGPSLPSGPFTVRIAVTNAESVTAIASARPNNASPLINVLAGNTDPGLGASAKAAVFFNDATDADEDPQSLAVTSTGLFYFRDARRGVLVVSPTDGLQRLLIPTTGTMSPDGPIAAATLQRPVRIAVDHADRLLVMDHDRIRRYDPVAGTFTTLIGGGTATVDGTGPLETQLAAMTLQIFRSKAIAFAALPNGDVYFEDKPSTKPSATGYRLRIYDAALDRMRSVVPNGVGVGTVPEQDVTGCSFYGTVLTYDRTTSSPTSFGATAYRSCGDQRANFDPRTGTARMPVMPHHSPAAWVTGMDGNAYSFSTTRGYSTDNRIHRYDLATNTLVRLVGTGASGSCPDDTPALSCAITPRDVFVTAQGQLFFMDRARLRTVEPATGNVVTVMGHSFAHGDGGPALAARFGSTSSISLLDDGEIIVADSREKRFRQFAIGGNIRTIAGNGIDGLMNRTMPATDQPLTFAGYHLTDDIAANPATGELVVASSTLLLKLNRTTGRWETFAGGGSTTMLAADGLVGSAISFGATISRMLGFDGTRYLLGLWGPSGGPIYKLYAAADGRQAGLMGVSGTEGAYCADGTEGTACPVPSTMRNTHTRATWDAQASRWAILGAGTTAIRSIRSGGTLGTITTLASAARSFAYRHDAALEVVHYCSTADDRLHKKDLRTGADTAYAWPDASVKCTGRALLYDAARDTLVFPYERNGLFGVAEYTAP